MICHESHVTRHSSRLARAWLDAQLHLQEPHHLAGFGVTPRGFLAVDRKVIRQHLEATAAGRDQLQSTNRGGEKVEQFARQTEGAGGVVSHHAIFDAEIELFHVASFVRCTHAFVGHITGGIAPALAVDGAPAGTSAHHRALMVNDLSI